VRWHPPAVVTVIATRSLAGHDSLAIVIFDREMSRLQRSLANVPTTRDE
jgi:hypothetical protein